MEGVLHAVFCKVGKKGGEVGRRRRRERVSLLAQIYNNLVCVNKWV